MSVPLQGFDFRVLDDPGFKEDAVREELISPVLHALGYRPSGRARISRSPRLQHPFVTIGTKKHPISIVPDYLLFVHDRPSWILDAKSPSESVDDPNHHAQVYSYAIHRDVRVDWYAICNGREFVVFNVNDIPKPKLRVSLSDLTTGWAELQHLLSPVGNVGRRGPFDKDFGLLLSRIGTTESILTFLGVDLEDPEIGRVDEGTYRLARRVEAEGGHYHASFDFNASVFADFVALLNGDLAAQLVGALEHPPALVRIQGHLGVIRLDCRLGELEESKRDQFIPLVVLAVARSPYERELQEP